jgi:Arylsulfotransferase (ASST)
VTRGVSASRETLLRIYWIASLCALACAYGIAVGVFKIFPYRQLKAMAYAGRELMRYPSHALRLSPEKFLVASPPEGRGVNLHVAGAASPGITLVTGFIDGSTGIRLIDIDGRLLNEWRISYNAVWPESPHLANQPHDFDTEVHGSMLLPDGDVIFTFQYSGLVRMDRCGRVKWKLPRQTHHLFVAAADGNLWVPSRELRDEPVREYPRIPVPFQEEYLLKVSPDGAVLREFSILDAVFAARYEGLLFANGAHDTTLEVPLDGDFTHLNDVEVLSAELAPAFPMFEAGDLLLSLRNLNLLMVMSPASGTIKWTQTGPFLRQHDPDFAGTGQIVVFDNRRDGSDGSLFGGSRIVTIDPATERVNTLYGARSGKGFHTATMGAQQPLPNGNLLITESEQGRAFEIDMDGKIVWSYVNRWTDGSVGQISQAERYPADYLRQSSKEPCHE